MLQQLEAPSFLFQQLCGTCVWGGMGGMGCVSDRETFVAQFWDRRVDRQIVHVGVHALRLILHMFNLSFLPHRRREKLHLTNEYMEHFV